MAWSRYNTVQISIFLLFVGLVQHGFDTTRNTVSILHEPFLLFYIHFVQRGFDTTRNDKTALYEGRLYCEIFIFVVVVVEYI